MSRIKLRRFSEPFDGPPLVAILGQLGFAYNGQMLFVRIADTRGSYNRNESARFR